MIRYAGRRLLRAAALLTGVSVFSFCLFELAPGDYFDEFRTDPRVSHETIAALREQYGLEGPATVRYMKWVGSVLRGDWGFSVAYNGPAGPLLFGRAQNTLILTVSAMLCSWIIGVPFAIWTVSGGPSRQLLARSLMSVLLSLPEIVVVLVLIALAAHSGILPAGGMSSPEVGAATTGGGVADLMLHLAVPLTALVLATVPSIVVHTRAALTESLNSSFIRFARANGIPSRRLIFRHALPAAANPMLSLFGLSVGTLLSSSLLVEAVAGWPGLGHLLLQALMQRDYLIVADAVLLSSIFLVAGNLLADLLLCAVDPRIRA